VCVSIDFRIELKSKKSTYVPVQGLAEINAIQQLVVYTVMVEKATRKIVDCHAALRE
jgi:hypothetical protein